MKWEKELPTQEGFYWTIRGHEKFIVEVVKDFLDENLVAVHTASGAQYPLSDYTLWYGPLAVPDLPIDS